MSFIMVTNHDDQFFKAIYYSIRYERYLRKLNVQHFADIKKMLYTLLGGFKVNNSGNAAFRTLRLSGGTIEFNPHD